MRVEANADLEVKEAQHASALELASPRSFELQASGTIPKVITVNSGAVLVGSAQIGQLFVEGAVRFGEQTLAMSQVLVTDDVTIAVEDGRKLRAESVVSRLPDATVLTLEGAAEFL